MTKLPRVYISTGGTKEPIDDVRYVTNFSTGKFGLEIARAFVDRRFPVTILGTREARQEAMIGDLRIENEFLRQRIGPARSPLLESAEFKLFTSTASLGILLDNVETPSIVLNAAAVSDYAPVDVTSGKIRSDVPEVNITMERTPKLMSGLRPKYGPGAMLVGFKLLSGASDSDLIAAAEKQVIDNQLDFSVANDLRRLGSGRHPVIIVTNDGRSCRVEGTSMETAGWIAHFACLSYLLRDPSSAMSELGPAVRAWRGGAQAGPATGKLDHR